MNVLSPMVAAMLATACLGTSSAHALDAATERAERDRIKAERNQAEAAYLTRERECRQRFVVTPCVDQARRDRRQSLERLRQQQEMLDEGQRKQRAAQRIDEIRTKVSGEDAKLRDAASRDRHKEAERAELRATSLPSQGTSSASAASGVDGGTSHPSPASHSASLEHKHLADYEKRQREAKAHKEAVERRNADRAATGKPPAKGLPVPDAASAAY